MKRTMKQTLTLADSLQRVDLSRVTPLLRASFACYKTAAERYADTRGAYQQHTQQAHQKLHEPQNTTPETLRPGENALGFLNRTIQQFELHSKAFDDFQVAQETRTAELDVLAQAYVKSNNRLISVYKGLQERGELTREDKQLLAAISRHDLDSFRQDQEGLSQRIKTAFSLLPK